jgi:hypothetical protein
MRAMNRLLLLVALAFLSSNSQAAVKTLKPIKTWSGRMPLVVQPLMQSSVADREQWQRVWTTCQMSDAPEEVDFNKNLVLVSVRRGNSVKFSTITLDKGNVKTSVVVDAEPADHYTCALAMVARSGIKTVNGMQLGR